MGQRIYVDSSVLIAVRSGKDPQLARKALEILNNPENQIVLSDAVRLEVMPKPIYEGRYEEREAYEEVFSNAELLRWEIHVLDEAYELACKYGIAAMDAIHLAFAVKAGVDIFITGEKSNKPLFRFNNDNPRPRIISLHE